MSATSRWWNYCSQSCATITPESFTKEEHQEIFHQPHPSFPGYPKMPVPDGMVAADDEEEGAR